VTVPAAGETVPAAAAGVTSKVSKVSKVEDVTPAVRVVVPLTLLAYSKVDPMRIIDLLWRMSSPCYSNVQTKTRVTEKEDCREVLLLSWGLKDVKC